MNSTDEFKKHVLEQFQQPIEEVERAYYNVRDISFNSNYINHELDESLSELEDKITALKLRLPTVQGGE